MSSPTVDASVKSPEAPVAVRIARVEERRWPTTINASGSLEAFERSTLGAKIAGRVLEIPVDVGSEVKSGAIVAKIDDMDARLRIAQSESLVHQARALLGLPLDGDDDTVEPEDTAQVRLARAVLAEADAKMNRASVLNSEGLLDDAAKDEAVAAAKVAGERVQSALQEVTNARGVLEQRRAELALARQQLADTAVRAPYDGIVVGRIAGRGDFVTVGTPLVALLRIDPLRLQLEIPERAAAGVRVGQTVDFTVEGDTTTHHATITRLPPELRSENLSLFAEADVANTSTDGSHPFRAGSFVRAVIVIDDAATTRAVPLSAVRSFAGVDRVLTIVDGAIKEVLIQVLRREAEFVEFRGDLEVGAPVILDPGNLATGRLVTVTN